MCWGWGAEAVRGPGVRRYRKAGVFRGADTPSGVWGGTGQVCIPGCNVESGDRPGRVEGVCVLLRTGLAGRSPGTVYGGPGAGGGIPLPTHIYPFGGLGALH